MAGETREEGTSKGVPSRVGKVTAEIRGAIDQLSRDLRGELGRVSTRVGEGADRLAKLEGQVAQLLKLKQASQEAKTDVDASRLGQSLQQEAENPHAGECQEPSGKEQALADDAYKLIAIEDFAQRLEQGKPETGDLPLLQRINDAFMANPKWVAAAREALEGEEKEGAEPEAIPVAQAEPTGKPHILLSDEKFEGADFDEKLKCWWGLKYE